MRVLQAVLENAAREARSAQMALREATAQFSAVSGRVAAQVGGSAQGVDVEMLESFERARRLTTVALGALDRAASPAWRAA